MGHGFPQFNHWVIRGLYALKWTPMVFWWELCTTLSTRTLFWETLVIFCHFFHINLFRSSYFSRHMQFDSRFYSCELHLRFFAAKIVNHLKIANINVANRVIKKTCANIPCDPYLQAQNTSGCDPYLECMFAQIRAPDPLPKQIVMNSNTKFFGLTVVVFNFSWSYFKRFRIFQFEFFAWPFFAFLEHSLNLVCFFSRFRSSILKKKIDCSVA